MNTKHTPGPWSFYEDKASAGMNGECIGIVESPRGIVCKTEESCPLETMANARLIAAAPEMLEALKRCLHDDAGNLEPETVHLAMEAIKKTEGNE